VAAWNFLQKLKAPPSQSSDQATMQAIGMAFNDRYQMQALVEALKEGNRLRAEDARAHREAIRHLADAVNRSAGASEALATAIRRA
jgi:hypothetical protein